MQAKYISRKMQIIGKCIVVCTLTPQKIYIFVFDTQHLTVLNLRLHLWSMQSSNEFQKSQCYSKILNCIVGEIVSLFVTSILIDIIAYTSKFIVVR